MFFGLVSNGQLGVIRHWPIGAPVAVDCGRKTHCQTNYHLPSVILISLPVTVYLSKSAL